MGRFIRPYGKRYFAWEFIGKITHPKIMATGPNGGFLFHHTVTIEKAFDILNDKLDWRIDDGIIFINHVT